MKKINDIKINDKDFEWIVCYLQLLRDVTLVDWIPVANERVKETLEKDVERLNKLIEILQG